jgi:deazaflavin-dependent oxidoreductase (nitroreductase family)
MTIVSFLVAVAVTIMVLGIAFVLGMRTRSPLLHKPLFWISRRWLNPRQMRTAGRPGAYAGVIRHVGRRSGRRYETPVGTAMTDEAFLVALPYGRRPDWLRNVLAGGSATVVHEGASYLVARPEVIPMTNVLDCFPSRDRFSMRLFRTDECLRLMREGAGPATTS